MVLYIGIELESFRRKLRDLENSEERIERTEMKGAHKPPIKYYGKP